MITILTPFFTGLFFVGLPNPIQWDWSVGLPNPILFLTNTGNHDTSSMIAFFCFGTQDGEIVSFFPSRRGFPAQGTGLASSSTWAEPTRPRGRPARRLGLRLPAGEYRPAPRRARDQVLTKH